MKKSKPRLQVVMISFCLISGRLPLFADHGPPENILPVTKGVYRLPFEDGTEVEVRKDHITHSTHNRIDMSPTDNSVEHKIVAAGDGWIEYIQDSFNGTCPKVTRTNPDPCKDYDGPSGKGNCCVGSICACKNNYVWIRHANGERSRYSHIKLGSVPDDLTVGAFVNAGDVIGVEGDVGFASSVHLHFEVGVPDSVDNKLEPDDPNYDPLGIDPETCTQCGFPNITADDAIVVNANRQNRIPVFCQIGFLKDGEVIDASSCDGLCTNSTELFGTIPDDGRFYRQVTDTMGNYNANFTIEGGAGASVRAGDSIILSPGFHAEDGSFFSASIGSCDSPGN